MLLLLVEHRVNLVRGNRLWPEDVAGVGRFFIEAVGSMTVEDGPAERDVILGVAIGTQRRVSARDDALKMVRTRFAEDGQRLPFAPRSARVVLQLLLKASVPFWVDQPLEDVVGDAFLLLGEETANDVSGP